MASSGEQNRLQQWLERAKQWLAPPVFADDDRTDKARTLNAFLLTFLLGMTGLRVGVAVAGRWIPGVPQVGTMETGFLTVLIILAVGLLIVLRLGYVQVTALGLVGLMWVGCSVMILEGDGVRDNVIAPYFLIVVLAAFVMGQLAVMTLVFLSSAVLVAAYLLERAGRMDMSSVLPTQVQDVMIMVGTLVISGIFLDHTVRQMQRTSRRAQEDTRALTAANEALTASRDELTRQTRRLARRTSYLDASMTVAQAAVGSVGDVQALLARVVTVITEQFGFYHAGIFWVDATGTEAVLQAASSEGGRRMLARGHRLPVGSGIVGTVAKEGRARLALDVGEDAVFFDNPDLPATRSEMAVPLWVRGSTGEARGTVIGVLDVQSEAEAAFDEEDLTVLQALADQVSLAVENARLLQEAQEALMTARRAYGEMTGGGWQQLLESVSEVGFISGPGGIQSLRRVGGEVASSPVADLSARRSGGNGTLVLPVEAGGRVIATVEAHLPEETGGWTPERVEVLTELLGQLSQALERARLYQETQRAAVLEQTIGEVTARIRAEVEIETVLERTLAELGEVLAAERGYAVLTLDESEEALKTEEAPV